MNIGASICVQDLESIAACEHASNFTAAYVMYEHGLRLGREAPGPKSLQKQVPIHCRPVATAEVGYCADEGSRPPCCGTRTPMIGFINAYEEAVLAIALMRPVDHPIVALEPQCYSLTLPTAFPGFWCVIECFLERCSVASFSGHAEYT